MYRRHCKEKNKIVFYQNIRADAFLEKCFIAWDVLLRCAIFLCYGKLKCLANALILAKSIHITFRKAIVCKTFPYSMDFQFFPIVTCVEIYHTIRIITWVGVLHAHTFFGVWFLQFQAQPYNVNSSVASSTIA